MNNDLATLFGGNPFDPSTVEPQGDFPVVPPGKTPVLIEKSEVRKTKKGNGHYVYLEMQVLEGPCKGQKLFDQINVDNPSAQCVEIGLRTLSALGRAIGLSTITDTAQLVNQVVVAHVKVKGDQNDIRTYSSTTEVIGAKPAQPDKYASHQAPMPNPPQQVAPAVGGTTTAPTSKPPWMK